MEGALSSVVLLPNLSVSITPDEKLHGDALHCDTTLWKKSFYFSIVLAMTRETESLVTVFKSQGGSMARKQITHVGKRCFHFDGSRPYAENVQDGGNKPGRERGSQLGIGPKPIGFSMIELRELCVENLVLLRLKVGDQKAF